MQSQGGLAFTLPPKKRPGYGSDQPSPASSSPVTFALDYSRIRALLPTDPTEVESLWKEFNPELSYSALITQLSEVTPVNFLAGLFQPRTADEPPLNRRLHSFLDYFPLILPRNGLLSFIGLPLLDLGELLQMIPAKCGLLLGSALMLIALVLRNLDSAELRQQFVFEFAVRLTPRELTQPESPREYMKYSLCLPLLNAEDRLFWLFVQRDQSIEVIPADGASESLISPGDQVKIRDKKVSICSSVFRFPTEHALEIWLNRQNVTDPLVSFVSSFKEVAAFRSALPAHFSQQLFEAVGAPDLVLAIAICQGISQTKRDLMVDVMSALSDADTLNVFLRSQYSKDIATLQDPSRIFRDNSIGMAATGILLRAHGAPLVDELTSILEAEAESTASTAILKWIPVLKRMPQFNRIILRNAFIAARRRYPEKLVPLTAISGLVMLRYVMADVGSRVPHMTKLLQGMMNITVFSPQMRQECTMATLVAVAECLLDLTRLKSNNVPKDLFRPDELIDVIAGSLGDILTNIAVASQPPYHPAVYSLQELIETVFMGVDEDPKQKLVGSVLF
jgi:hypothetical protein